MFTQLNSIQIQSLIKIYSDAEKKGYWISIKIKYFFIIKIEIKFELIEKTIKNFQNGWIYSNQG